MKQSINEFNNYIHYGSNCFQKERFRPIRNCERAWVKPTPESGLWASPTWTSYGWKDYCSDNLFLQDRLNDFFIFSLKEDSKILLIRDNIDLERLSKRNLLLQSDDDFFNRDLYLIDFEKCLQIGYDAIEVYINSMEIYNGLYGWDCDSILILNPDCIDI